MNKYQEALDYAKKHLDSKQDLERIGVLQELIDKESPKKPHEKYYQIICGVDDIMNCIDYHDTMNFIDYHCPSCGKKVVSDIVNYKEYRHCYHCGQAIDWSDEDDEQRRM